MMTQTVYLRVPEAAVAVRVCAGTIRRWVRSGTLPARRVRERGPLLISIADLEEALKDAAPALPHRPFVNGSPPAVTPAAVGAAGRPGDGQESRTPR
jgi:excisionase family DNA binding protein